MAEKLGRREFPSGYTPGDFEYKGRPANDQGDFGSDVGIADCACVNQFGDCNNAKFYHGGVVQASDGTWFLYTEWGRCKPGPSWSGSSFTGNAQDFQFVRCGSESEARSEFAKKLESKNVKRLTQIDVGGKAIWAGKKGKDGYLVQRLATREKGLPDALKIKDASGVTATAKAKTAKPAAKAKTAKGPTRKFDNEVVSLASALVGGTQTFARSLAAASGITPTMDSIEEVRNDLIPAALQRIKAVGDDIDSQVRDSKLVAISKMVAALVPRPIPRKGQSAEEAILSGSNILVLQQDLDAFEGALLNEDFEVEATDTTVNPDSLLNARLSYLDPRSDGKWVAQAFAAMTSHRHGYIRGHMNVKHIFVVERPDRDARFMKCVKQLAAKRQGRFNLTANLQPRTRNDLNGVSDDYGNANVVLAIHGTRPVNIAPIMGTNFRLPKSLPGAQITGANFGHGVYFATDWKKSYGYTGRGYWGHSGGDIARRGCFMFLCDMAMGDPYRAPRTGSWSQPPDGKDSVFGVGGDRGHRLENDEHVIFNPDYQRIRYLVEFDWLT